MGHLPVAGLENLLREILVDHSRLQAQAIGRVDILVRVFSWSGRVDGCLVHRQVVQLACFPLVQEQRAVHLNSEERTHKLPSIKVQVSGGRVARWG